MPTRTRDVRVLWLALCTLVLGAGLASCKKPEAPTPQPTAPAEQAPAETAAPAEAPAAAPAPAAQTSWTPEALEDLLAPVALFPDPVLSQVLIASTNPQEVLDAGNWLLENQSLKGKPLDDAAAAIGFTPPVRALVQFPQVVDMMCLEMGWTTELGQAFVTDQAGVLDAVQRLRKQAVDVGNLQSSDQMVVETQVQEQKEVVVLKPAQPEVVYVPQYDPVAAYAPPPAAPAPATTTTTTTTTEDKGHSTGAMVATGVLAFGAGILVNELFDDDDDDYRHDYYYPNYGYGGMPYYPPYPYRPAYGGGFYPGSGYNRPPGYGGGFNNSGNIIINTGGGQRGDYWNRYDNNGPRQNDRYQSTRAVNSPITAAKPTRTDLNELNRRQPRAKPANVQPPSATTTASNWKGQSGYKGAKKDTKAMSSQERIANATPGYSKPAKTAPGTREAPRAAPKVQGGYAGATPDRVKPSVAAQPATRDIKPASKPQGDRGYTKPTSKPMPVQKPMPSQKPTATPRPVPSAGGASRGSALAGSQNGKTDRAASQRGKQSMPQGARSKGGGGGAQKTRR